MNKINVVTIDGPSASGKGELAKSIAHHFDFKLLDSGILYRLFAYFFNLKFNNVINSESFDKLHSKLSSDCKSAFGCEKSESSSLSS